MVSQPESEISFWWISSEILEGYCANTETISHQFRNIGDDQSPTCGVPVHILSLSFGGQKLIKQWLDALSSGLNGKIAPLFIIPEKMSKNGQKIAELWPFEYWLRDTHEKGASFPHQGRVLQASSPGSDHQEGEETATWTYWPSDLHGCSPVLSLDWGGKLINRCGSHDLHVCSPEIITGWGGNGCTESRDSGSTSRRRFRDIQEYIRPAEAFNS